METYTQLVLAEIRNRKSFVGPRTISSVYFGGGTPSLLPIDNTLAILKELHNSGFIFGPGAEVTIEINPGTIDPERLDLYRSAGINRFSLGVQSFNLDKIKAMGREHSVDQTWRDIELLNTSDINFSADFLFGLPNQSLQDFNNDLDLFKSFKPKHISAYNLTVPSGHPMSVGRADDEVQAEMFDLIELGLKSIGVERYELSNYAKPGFEGRHNSLYWNDDQYWGVGVSSHSYLKTESHPLGIRFWNSPNSKIYEKQAPQQFESAFFLQLPQNQFEVLKTHEALTDYCHTQLRKISGLKLEAFRAKFGDRLTNVLNERFRKAQNMGLVASTNDGFSLTSHGRKIANRSFLEFTFSEKEII